MLLHVLYLEKENGNVLHHLPEKLLVPVEKQMKRSIFSGTCNFGQMVQQFPIFLVKARSAYHLNGIFGNSGEHSNGTVHPGGMFSEKR